MDGECSVREAVVDARSQPVFVCGAEEDDHTIQALVLLQVGFHRTVSRLSCSAACSSCVMVA